MKNNEKKVSFFTHSIMCIISGICFLFLFEIIFLNHSSLNEKQYIVGQIMYISIFAALIYKLIPKKSGLAKSGYIFFLLGGLIKLHNEYSTILYRFEEQGKEVYCILNLKNYLEVFPYLFNCLLLYITFFVIIFFFLGLCGFLKNKNHNVSEN